MNFNVLQIYESPVTYFRFKFIRSVICVSSLFLLLIFCFMKVQYAAVQHVGGFSRKAKWRCKTVVTARSSLGDTRSK
jgi:hypothetical protein